MPPRHAERRSKPGAPLGAFSSCNARQMALNGKITVAIYYGYLQTEMGVGLFCALIYLNFFLLLVRNSDLCRGYTKRPLFGVRRSSVLRSLTSKFEVQQ